MKFVKGLDNKTYIVDAYVDDMVSVKEMPQYWFFRAEFKLVGRKRRSTQK